MMMDEEFNLENIDLYPEEADDEDAKAPAKDNDIDDDWFDDDVLDDDSDDGLIFGEEIE